VIKRIRVIGIGMGSPAQVTGEAAAAIASVDVFLVADKGERTADLVEARQALVDAFVPDRSSYRFVEVPDPHRGPDAERDAGAYDRGVRDWHAARVEAYASVVAGLAEGEDTVGFLVWGDPAFYDSTIRVVDALLARWAAQGVRVEHDVLPGISAPQLLAARHRIPLNRIGAPVHVTTGRRLVDEYDGSLGDVVVMLDGGLACAGLVDVAPDLELFWGAYLGTPDELLVRGRLADVLDEVRRVRADARERHGWVMDTYLLRGPEGSPTPAHAGPTLPAFPEVVSLSDGTLTLRPVTASDWPVVLGEHNNDEQLRWGFTDVPMTEAEARQRAALAPREWRLGRAARFVMVDAATGEGAGLIGVLTLGPPGVGLVGYGVLPAFRGRGFTTRALVLVTEWVFAQTDIVRLELGHKVDNVASGRAAEKAGYVREGVHAARLVNPDGTRSDEVVWARVRPS
jgi:precorrin-6A synthase (deacetylating)